MSDLKPCPFCGETPKAHVFDAGFGGMQVDCQTVNCPASPITSGDSLYDPIIAFNAWNTRATPTLSAAMELPEIKAIHTAAEYFAKKRKSIMTDIGSAHSSRGAGASSWMREDDNDFYHALDNAFDELSAAIAPFTEAKP